MTAANHACPHCGSHNNRILADHMGRIGWCRDCHRTWEQAATRPIATTRMAAEILSQEVILPFRPRHG